MTGGSAAHPEQAVRRIDLHLHSTASDGLLSPRDMVHAAHAAGVTVIALTDHDSVEGLEEARLAARPLAVEVVAGVELSAHDGERELHILGLHLDRPEALRERLAGLTQARQDRAREMVHNLNAAGVRIEFADVLALAGSAALGRPHVARALVAHGWAQDHRDAFERYLTPGRPGYVAKRRLTVHDAIAMLHEAGGIAVIAHPASEDSLERLGNFARLGLDGIEVAHPSLVADERAHVAFDQALQLAAQHALGFGDISGREQLVGNGSQELERRH